MKLNKQKNLKNFEKNYNRKQDCSINKASNEIMLDRISGGKDIDFPFALYNEQWLFNIWAYEVLIIIFFIKQTLKFY